MASAAELPPKGAGEGKGLMYKGGAERWGVRSAPWSGRCGDYCLHLAWGRGPLGKDHESTLGQRRQCSSNNIR